MNRFNSLAVVTLGVVLSVFSFNSFAAAPPTGALAGGAAMPSLAPMVAEASPAVVNISIYTKAVARQNPLLNDPFFRRFFNLPDQPQQPQGRAHRAAAAGSGVIVDAKKGYVLTNAHVIKDADEIKVTLIDGRTIEAKLIGEDPQVDLAVLQIEANKLTQIPLADGDNLNVGDYVVAIGNPFGLGQTVTSGIVSALGRTGLGIESYENFIQTDASINPGNSGGALVNLRGELVGVPTAILAPSGGNVGIGFAIPISMVTHVMDQLIEHGKVSRAMLGVTIQSLTSDLAQALQLDKDTKGVIISQVMDDSAAAKAGLEAGDVVTELEGKTVKDASDFRNRIGLSPIGKKVKLTVYRDGKKKTITAKLGGQIEEQTASASSESNQQSPFLEGANLRTLQPGDVQYAEKGVLVSQVQQGSTAASAGLRAGDVIITANNKSVANLKDLQSAINKKDKTLLLRINRQGGIFFLVIRE